jgi:hypothetical protein
MRRFIRGAVILLVAFWVFPVLAEDKKPAAPDAKKDLDKKPAAPDAKKDLDKKPGVPDAKKDLDKTPGKKLDVSKDLDKKDTGTSEKMLKAGQLQGKVLTIVESKKSLRLQITFYVPKLNQGALNGLLQAQQNLLRAQLSNNLQQMIQAQAQIAQNQAQMYQSETITREVELQTIEDVKVRMLSPPPQFDDKGRIKRYTTKELKELRGSDPKLPGYQAEFGDLHEGQTVLAHLIKKKGAPLVAPVRKGGKDVDVDALMQNLPQVSMIVIVAEPPK